MRPLPLLTGLLLMVFAAAGWGWGWREYNEAQAAAFARQRVGFLEAENRRLSGLLAEGQAAREADADRTARAEIERRVAELRELDFTKPVTYREIPRSELPRILREKLAQQVPDQEFDRTGLALAVLGLVPAGLDLKKTYLDLLGEQVGAFYDQHTGELYTFSGHPLNNSQNRVILAHELTHALEDQHFHLARLPLEAKGNDDRALAASALVEGDATLVMNQYLVGSLSAAVLKDNLAGALSTDVRQLAAVPIYLRNSLLFPYLRGQEFCTALFEHGGWAALDAAFAHPPASTEQILHPERYLASPSEEPLAVNFPAGPLLGQESADENVLGEFGTAQFLARWLKDDKLARATAAGWRGDRFRVYGDARVNSSVWKSAWISDAAASTFFMAAVRAAQAHYALTTTAEATRQSNDGAEFTQTTADGKRALCIRRRGAWVTWVDAQDAQWRAALLQMAAAN